MSGRKLHPEYECIVDNWIYTIVEPLSVFFHNYDMTPNQITTLSLIAGLISIKCLYESIRCIKCSHLGYLAAFAAFFSVSYILDCVDGYYARKYKMTSEFGDKYDHFKDWFINIAVIVVLYKYTTVGTTCTLIIIASLFLSAVHMGCQECLYDKDNDKHGCTLSLLKGLCPTCDSPEDSLRYTRYAGMGSFVLIFIAVLCATVVKHRSE